MYAYTESPVLRSASCSLVDAQKLGAFKVTLHNRVQCACVYKAHKTVSFAGYLQEVTALEPVGD